MSKLKLPGSCLLDRCIGRSTFEYTKAIKINPFEQNLCYDSYIKTLSKYEPNKYNHSWTYTTPFGRLPTCRINLGSSKRTFCLHVNDDNNQPTNMEIYEYCCGSIRNSLFMFQNTPLLPSTLIEYLFNAQYRLACYFAEKYPHSFLDQCFDTLYRTKLIDSKTFTSTQSNVFPKWCSSISLVRVLKAKTIDFDGLMDDLNQQNNCNMNENKMKGESDINISKDINYEIEKQKENNNNNNNTNEYAMKDEYQSDIIRHYSKLSKFDLNYECQEMYLILSTRYAVSSASFLYKLLFLPHWITVKLLSNITHENILKDIANNLDFVANKNAENDNNEPHWHKYRPHKKKKV